MLASFSSQHLESHLHDPGNPLYDSITKNDALTVCFSSIRGGQYSALNNTLAGMSGSVPGGSPAMGIPIAINSRRY